VIRPLRRVRPGIARSRDQRFELVRGLNCWQVRSLTSDGATLLQGGGSPPECRLRRELVEWLEAISGE
jgi:hypothetical protein